jgi:hypothetical protein
MACRGVHFALSRTQERRLLAAETDDEVMDVVEAVEEEWDHPHLVETDKAWDAIHRCLTDGECRTDNGDYPLSHVVLGGQQLHAGDDFIVSYVPAEQVEDLVAALRPLDRDWLRQRYAELDPSDYGPEHGAEDFEYTWENFVELREFLERAAAGGRAVIFTVDQ